MQSKNFKNSGSEGQTTSGWHCDPAVWAQHILSCIGDAIISTDISGRITYLNPAAERMTGWSVQEALGRPLAEVMKIIDAARCESPRHLTEAAIDQDAVVHLAANRILIRRDGMETVIEDSVAAIHDRGGHGTGAVIVFRALTQEARAKALRMSRLAQYDWLTDLPNRMLLNDRLGVALALATRYKRPMAVLFVDLDRFKQVNDSAGHAIGDRVLQSTAKRLLACVRSSDTVSRYGGDEFVILLSEIDDSRSLMPFAKKILAAIAAPHNLEPHVFHITASIGVSIFPQDGRDGETLIQGADAAMYWAKRNGRNNIQLLDRRLKTQSSCPKVSPAANPELPTNALGKHNTTVLIRKNVRMPRADCQHWTRPCMRNGIKILKMLQAVLGVAVLTVGIGPQANGYEDQGSQNCRGDSQANPTSNITAGPSGSPTSSSKPHSVRLSWDASVPASNSPADAIRGYNVYRRSPGKEYEKINTDLIRGRSCVDYLVKAGQTYYYEAKAVSTNGAVSKPSPEVKAVIPSR